MKHLITLLLALMTIQLQATIWRVNNATGVDADFSNLQSAINSATAGDTIYVEGSTLSYTNPDNARGIHVYKQLVIMGPGYLLGENDSTLYRRSSAIINDYINIYPGAAGTVIQGLRFNTYAYSAADNVTWKRNYINSYLYLGTYYDSLGTNIDNNTINQLITQNYLYGDLAIYATTTSCIISNNIIHDHIGADTDDEFYIINNTVLYSGTSINVYNSVLENNVCTGIIAQNTNTLTNNLVDIYSTQAQHFVGGALTESQFMLKSTSTGVGAGTDGTDCGAFGGVTPYVLSGLPPIPHIYELIAPISGSSSTGLPVTVKVKTQN